MIREVVTKTTVSTKLKLVGSQIDQVRSQDETETAIRMYDGQHIGIASSVGQANIELMTHQAREALAFKIPYPVQPEQNRSLSASRPGQWRSLEELVAFTNTILGALNDEHSGYIFDGGTEQRRTEITLKNDAGLDLSYSAVHTETTLWVRERGSGSILDTLTGLEGEHIQPEEVIAECHRLLRADANKLTAPPTGRQRLVFPVVFRPFLSLFMSDLSARSLRQETSVFAPAFQDRTTLFHPDVHLVDSQDHNDIRVMPFDMEGVIRDVPNLDLIKEGRVQQFFANKRDSILYDVPPTGSAGGDLAGTPNSTSGTLRFMPTQERLVDLLGGEPAIWIQLTAGGDITRKGEIALPAQAAYRVEADGTLSGKYPEFSVNGSLYDILGEDFIGVSNERICPHSDATFFATHMNIRPNKQ